MPEAGAAMIIKLVLASVEIALVGVFLVAAADAAIYRGACRTDVRIGEVHHLYVGMLMVVVGVFVSPWLMLAGVLVSADDAYQHGRQVWACEPEFRSPLHRLFAATLWKLRWVQRLAKWLNERL